MGVDAICAQIVVVQKLFELLFQNMTPKSTSDEALPMNIAGQRLEILDSWR